MALGRLVLGLLVAIHWILPFTPANQHEEMRIIVASLILGAAFLALLVRSYKHPTASFSIATGLLALVVSVSAITAASPILEGALVKLVFLGSLAWAVGRSRRRVG
jgi:predicted branched-subunit amino acid permease